MVAEMEELYGLILRGVNRITFCAFLEMKYG